MAAVMRPFPLSNAGQSDVSRQLPMQPPPVPAMRQSMMDSRPDDGAISVAYNLQPSMHQIRAVRPNPFTKQYARHTDWVKEDDQPRSSTRLCGWVQACDDPNNLAEEGQSQLPHNEQHLVFLCISGWALLMWRSEEDFEAGVHGGPGKPRPWAWWDLRKCHDVLIDIGQVDADICPHRLSIFMNYGVVFFRVELLDEIARWYKAIRNVIKDSAVHHAKIRDTVYHQNKRWPCAVGVAKTLLSGQSIGTRAMAIMFHCYDLQYRCWLGVGEVMVLISEVYAARLVIQDAANDRESAVYMTKSYFTEDEAFERAMRFCKHSDADCNNQVMKDEFILYGEDAIREALDMPAAMPPDEGGWFR